MEVINRYSIGSPQLSERGIVRICCSKNIRSVRFIRLKMRMFADTVKREPLCGGWGMKFVNFVKQRMSVSRKNCDNDFSQYESENALFQLHRLKPL